MSTSERSAPQARSHGDAEQRQSCSASLREVFCQTRQHAQIFEYPRASAVSLRIFGYRLSDNCDTVGEFETDSGATCRCCKHMPQSPNIIRIASSPTVSTVMALAANVPIVDTGYRVP
jgi:hypothetical protein